MLNGDHNAMVAELAHLNSTNTFGRSLNSTNVNAKHGPCGWTWLHYICSIYNEIENPDYIMRLVSEYGANVNEVNDLLLTPLYMVASRANYRQKYIRALLKCKANPNTHSSGGETVLDAVVWSGNLDNDVIWLLLEHGTIVHMHNHLPHIVLEMDTGRQHARRAAIVLLGIKRFRRSKMLDINSVDANRLVAKYVWESRVEYHTWQT